MLKLVGVYVSKTTTDPYMYVIIKSVIPTNQGFIN